MESSNNFFEIFGATESFDVDSALLAQRYRELQQQFHPDRFADKPERERNRSVQWSATINQAFDTLKSPLKRAQYLLQLQGLDGTGETTVTADPMFLMSQMELREALAEVRGSADPFSALDTLRHRVEQDYQQQQQSFARHYGDGGYPEAQEVVAKMQFSSKLLAEMEQMEEDLDEL